MYIVEWNPAIYFFSTLQVFIPNGIYSGHVLIILVSKNKPTISSHVARRTFGRRWIDSGGKLDRLSKFFRHSSVPVTQKCIGGTDEEMEEDYINAFDNKS